MLAFTQGKYQARMASGAADVKAAQHLRYLAFFGDANPGVRGQKQTAIDKDEFDSFCQHVLVEDLESGQLVCCFRLMVLHNGAAIHQSYAAQYYDLSALASVSEPLLELGRFCIHPDRFDPDILRIAWAMMARFVDDNQVSFLFGCTSFKGQDAARYQAAFAMLRDQHLAPAIWNPGVKAPQVFHFTRQSGAKYEPREAMLLIPTLLRSYLAMGGWVSDHAVIDPAMNTIHVFTGLEISAIPAARVRRMRAVAS